MGVRGFLSVFITIILFLPYEAASELWRCKGGVYKSTPSGDDSCEEVHAATKCVGDGSRVIAAVKPGANSPQELCARTVHPDPFVAKRVIAPVRNFEVAANPKVSSDPHLDPNFYAKFDPNKGPSIAGLSDIEIARRSAHDPTYMQKWADSEDSTTASMVEGAYPGMGSYHDMNEDLKAFKRGEVPPGYEP